MCGIAGYVSKRLCMHAPEIILKILQALEYRGYDSAGLAVRNYDQPIGVVKVKGKVKRLTRLSREEGMAGNIGLGHVRWATHGIVSPNNAHPHSGGKGENKNVWVVHNGTIENYQSLKEELVGEGYEFVSTTDTEVIAHLIDSYLEKMPGKPKGAIQAAIKRLTGAYALGIMLSSVPDGLYVVRNKPPLVVGRREATYFISSDPQSLSQYVQEVATPPEGEVIFISSIGASDTSLSFRPLEKEDQRPTRGTYKHFMLKEIFEQPSSIERAMEQRLDDNSQNVIFPGLSISLRQWQRIKRIIITACGTSYYAALVGEYLIEHLAHIPVEVEYASELRYRRPPLENGTWVVAVSQSGETADTLAAIQECKSRKVPVLAICNVKDSTMCREVNHPILLHAGPEIGVASTKAFTSQIVVLTLLALRLGRIHNLSASDGEHILAGLRTLPHLAEETLKCNMSVQGLAQRYYKARNFLYLGTGYNFPVALEGALKLKEISYINAQGCLAAEIKHGPIALVDQHTPTVFTLPPPHATVAYGSIMNNVEQIKSRKGPVIAIACEGDSVIEKVADHVIWTPPVAQEYLQPVISVIPAQLLAYHIACLRKKDVDQPRNLAKSVTVQ